MNVVETGTTCVVVRVDVSVEVVGIMEIVTTNEVVVDVKETTVVEVMVFVARDVVGIVTTIV